MHIDTPSVQLHSSPTSAADSVRSIPFRSPFTISRGRVDNLRCPGPGSDSLLYNALLSTPYAQSVCSLSQQRGHVRHKAFLCHDSHFHNTIIISLLSSTNPIYATIMPDKLQSWLSTRTIEPAQNSSTLAALDSHSRSSSQQLDR